MKGKKRLAHIYSALTVYLAHSGEHNAEWCQVTPSASTSVRGSTSLPSPQGGNVSKATNNMSGRATHKLRFVWLRGWPQSPQPLPLPTKARPQRKMSSFSISPSSLPLTPAILLDLQELPISCCPRLRFPRLPWPCPAGSQTRRQQRELAKSVGLGSDSHGFSSSQPLISCVSLGKSLSFSGPYSP